MTNMPDADSARKLARLILDERLAACVNILPSIQSIYRWEGAIEDASEIPIHIKTMADRYPDLELAIKNMHPYQVPEIIAIPITEVSMAYLEWIRQETRKQQDA
ncbi:MAG TPA: divalent-cation tolerance protein CutA [Noviherbaspirillum sp.]|uniref:divalent-cation tolerance protein CutA n=1 Tax=Noviherbaspirillum sp. TaxID=1926288 RepID=UPI002DDD1FA3|nr:divalent-cation tolerance protein CutA [Noviherbaspirillum sp.]HEV2609674.1 divalent-cation tolerance protein CutA [Noviherbaspirillum sp.]